MVESECFINHILHFLSTSFYPRIVPDPFSSSLTKMINCPNVAAGFSCLFVGLKADGFSFISSLNAAQSDLDQEIDSATGKYSVSHSKLLAYVSKNGLSL